MPRCRRWMLLAATLAATKPVFADDEHAGKVVAVHTDPGVASALRVALVSWHVDVVVSSDAETPGTKLDTALESARRIARAEDARAVVWIEGGSLWVYDDRAHAVAVRPLPSPPPWDEATSAALALTVKTLLLSAFEAPQETHTPLPVRERPPPPKKKTKPTPPAPIHTVRILTLAGMRVPTNASDQVAARFGAEVAYFPSFAHGRAGLAIATDVGPSILVEHAPYFAGTFTDTIGSAQLRFRVPLRSWLGLELGAGPGVHFSALEGSSSSLGLAGRVTRVDGSVEAMLGVELAWKILRVSPIVGSSFLLHYQHYAASGVQVLDVPHGQMLYALRIGVELP